MSATAPDATGSMAQEIQPEGGPRSGPSFETAVDGQDMAAAAGRVAIDDAGSDSAGAPEPGNPGRLAEIKSELAMTPGRNRMYDLEM